MIFLYLLLALANMAFATIFTDPPPAPLTTPHESNETARPHAVVSDSCSWILHRVVGTYLHDQVFQFQYIQEQGKYYTFLTMDELRSKPSYSQAQCYQSV